MEFTSGKQSFPVRLAAQKGKGTTGWTGLAEMDSLTNWQQNGFFFLVKQRLLNSLQYIYGFL